MLLMILKNNYKW